VGELIEIEDKRRMRREDAAELLREVADMLARHNDVELKQGTTTVRVHVPDEVDVEVEVELKTDGGELEIELSW
jgi:amphi-Trp domain-containing protein